MSALKVLHRHAVSGAPSLLVVYVGSPVSSQASYYQCDVQEFFRPTPELDALDCHVLLYEYVVRIDDGFKWGSLLDANFDLLESVRKFLEDNKDDTRPIVFIGEGLGGLVIKQMFWEARRRLYRYRHLLTQIAGIIFLATPHRCANEEETPSRLTTLLRAYSRAASQKATTADEMRTYNLCIDRFEELALQVPVLSAYETEESRITTGRFASRKTATVVDKGFASVRAAKEEQVGFDGPLSHLLNPNTESNARLDIIRYLISCQKEARGRMLAALERVPMQPIRIPSMKTPTPVPSVVEAALPSIPPRQQSSSTDAVILTPSRTPSSDRRSGIPGSGSDIAEQLSDVSIEARRIKLPCHFTRPHSRNRDFFSRSAILNLVEEALLPNSTSSEDDFQESLRTFVLCGMGGLGKTEIAVEFAFSQMKAFDAIFIFHADQRNTLADEFHQAAVRLGIQTSLKMDPQDSRELLKLWLADPWKTPARSYGGETEAGSSRELAKWLIIFDNADDPDVLSDYWPTDGKGSVLVTSRNPMAKTGFFFGDNGADLSTLPTPDAARWIMQLTQSNPNDATTLKAADQIAERLDGLPLAIKQITSVIRMRQVSLTEFVELYEDETERPEFQSLRLGNRRGYEHNLASVWMLGNLGAGPFTLLSVVSMLDPDGIPEEILKTAMEQCDVRDYPRTPREYHESLTPLLQTSIVQREINLSQLSLHRLVTDVVRTRLQGEGRFVEMFDLAVDLVCSVWPFWRMGAKAGAQHNVDRWAQSSKLYPHVYRLYKKFPIVRQILGSLRPFEKFADLLIEAAW